MLGKKVYQNENKGISIEEHCKQVNTQRQTTFLESFFFVDPSRLSTTYPTFISTCFIRVSELKNFPVSRQQKRTKRTYFFGDKLNEMLSTNVDLGEYKGRNFLKIEKT